MTIAQNLSIIKKDSFQDYVILLTAFTKEVQHKTFILDDDSKITTISLRFANEVKRNVNKRLNKHLTSNKDYESDNILIIESKPRHGFDFKIETLKERNVKH